MYFNEHHNHSVSFVDVSRAQFYPNRMKNLGNGTFFFLTPLSMAFSAPIFTHLVTAQRYYVHNYVDCLQNRPDMEGTDRNPFTTFSEVWLTRPVFTKLVPAVKLVIRIFSIDFHENPTKNLVAIICYRHTDGRGLYLGI